MSLSVPYHPYSSCLICGEDGISYDESLEVTRRKLNRCSGCKEAVYCSKGCQKKDWKVHRRECSLLQVQQLRIATLFCMH